MYLSVSRYRSAGFGIDVSDIPDSELRAVLVRASALVDVYCAIPMQPSRHDFRGGTITGEQHEWRLATDISPGARRVYFLHRPILDVSSFKVKFTNLYEVAIDPANLYINHLQGWAEVVSLAAVVSGVYPVGINFGLYTPVAEVSYSYGYTFSATNDTLYAVDGNTFQGSHAAWLPEPVVKVDGVVQTSGYSVSADDGEVEFDTPQAAEAVITADYSYSLPDPIAEATGIIAANLLGERALAAKGMSGLASIRVAEVELARSNRGTLSLAAQSALPERAMSLLDPYSFRSVG